MNTQTLNIQAIKTIVSELNYMKADENPENIFEISFDESGDLIIDWQTRLARVLITNLAKELGLDYKSDFKIGHTRVEDIPERLNSKEKVISKFAKRLNEYIDIAEVFTR